MIIEVEFKEIIEPCTCGCEVVRLTFTAEVYDGLVYHFDSLADLYYRNQGLRDRLRAIWHILRGRDHYMWEVILKPAQAKRIADFIYSHLDERDESG